MGKVTARNWRKWAHIGLRAGLLCLAYLPIHPAIAAGAVMLLFNDTADPAVLPQVQHMAAGVLALFASSAASIYAAISLRRWPIALAIALLASGYATLAPQKALLIPIGLQMLRQALPIW